MRMRVQAAIINSVEIDGVVFSTPDAVDRFIRALEAAKKVVWETPVVIPADKKK